MNTSQVGDPRQQAGLELPAVAEEGTAASLLCANTAVRHVEEVGEASIALLYLALSRPLLSQHDRANRSELFSRMTAASQ